MRQQRPTPLDEVRSGLIVFEQSLWDALPRYLRSVDRALRAQHGPRRCRSTPRRSASARGSAATATATRTSRRRSRAGACLLSRWVAADLYLREIDALRDELSMASGSAGAARAWSASARAVSRAAARRARAPDGRHARRWVEGARLRAATARRPAPDGRYVDRDGELARRCGSATLARRDRQRHHRRRPAHRPAAPRRAFGVDAGPARHPAGAARHTEALDAITRALGLGSYAEWDEPARLEFLLRELAGRRPLIPRDLDATPEVRDVLDTFRTIARHPAESLGAYVITMARRPRTCSPSSCCRRRPASRAPLRVVPLFETLARPAQRRRDARRAAGACRGTARASRPPGSDGRLLRLGQGRRPASAAAGSSTGAGGDRRGLPRARRRASRCSTAAAAASAAAAGRPTWRSSRSRPARSTARCASPSRAR